MEVYLIGAVYMVAVGRGSDSVELAREQPVELVIL